jgi:tRNA A-37 threonylcarbamoyl transferase component Bud32
VAAPTEAATAPATPGGAPPLAAVQAAFPHLEILGLIGTGGMGSVFKARQPKLDRLVALKLLSPSLAASPAFAERFHREARVLARLSHPGIVSVFDFGQANGFFYLLMEFVDGVNLRQAMRAGPFTPAQALALVPKICEALEFAHGEGILHRDIKPENILLDTRGRLKIADFGIAKLVGEPRSVTRLTATGAALGTPQYMAPEQLEHPEDVDQRADIYSLGVVFYEMLTGELPLGRFAPPSEKSPVDPRVDAVVFRALEKERERRYGTAGEVKTSVEHLTQPPAAPPLSARPAIAPVFDPAKDFILCPPQLPRMAQAIIVYALIGAPVLWLLGLFALDPLPKHPMLHFLQGAVNLFEGLAGFVLMILMVLGGWKLRGLRTSAATWLKTALWLRLGLFLLSAAGQLWVEILADQVTPDRPAPPFLLREGFLVILGLGALVFEISSLVWLHRHRTALWVLCQTQAGPPPNPSTPALPVPAMPPPWSRVAVVGAVLVALSLPIPLFFGIAITLRWGAVGPAELALALGVILLLAVPGTILGWMGLSDIRADEGRRRGLPLGLFAALAWPLGLLVGATLVLPALMVVEVSSTGGPSPLSRTFRVLFPLGVLALAGWAVVATARWAGDPPDVRRPSPLKWVFLAVLVAIAGVTATMFLRGPHASVDRFAGPRPTLGVDRIQRGPNPPPTPPAPAQPLPHLEAAESGPTATQPPQPPAPAASPNGR